MTLPAYPAPPPSLDAASAVRAQTAANRRELDERTKADRLRRATRNGGRLYLGGSGRQQMLQRMARAGWGRITAGIFEINEAGRKLAATED